MDTPPSPAGRLLIVDDEPQVLGLLEAVLGEAGYACELLGTAGETLAAVDREAARAGPNGWSPWDLLLLDVSLPDMEGYDLLEAIRRRTGFATVPVMFMSGARLEEPDIERGLALGALEYFAKPFHYPLLVAKVNNFVELGRFRRAAHQTALTLVETESHYRALFEGIGDPVLLHDLGGHVHAVNPAATALLGLGEGELRSANLNQSGFEQYVREVAARLQEADPQGRLPLFETSLRSREGRVIDVEVHARAVTGRPSGILSVLRDITARQFEARRALLISSVRGAQGRHRSAPGYLDEVLQTIADYAGCACVGVRAADSDGNVPYLAWRGFSEEFVNRESTRELNEGQSICAALLLQDHSALEGLLTAGGSLLCDDLATLRETVPFSTLDLEARPCLAPPFESLALVPIRRGADVVGLIHVADVRRRALAAPVVEALEEVSVHLGAALRQYGLEESLAWEKRQTEIALGLTAGILAGEPLEDAVRQVLERIAGFTEFEVLAIERFVPEQDRLEMWMCHCPCPDTERTWEAVSCDETAAGQVARTGEILIELEIQDTPERLPPAFRGLGIRKFAAFPIRYRERIIGVLSIGTSRQTRPRSQIVEFLSALADQLALAISWAEAHEALARSRRELRSLSGQLIRAQEDERGRLARELHDSLGQILTSLRIDIDRQVARLAPDDFAFLKTLARLRTNLEEAQTTVRQLTASLRPGILDDLGLVVALESYFEDFEQHTGLACRFDNATDSPVLSPDVSTALYRVAQEALTNVVRHACAGNVWVRFAAEGGDRLVLSVKDDGRGFDLAALNWQTCFGMLGMRERLQLVGGQLHIATRPGEGTEILAVVPLGG